MLGDRKLWTKNVIPRAGWSGCLPCRSSCTIVSWEFDTMHMLLRRKSVHVRNGVGAVGQGAET